MSGIAHSVRKRLSIATTRTKTVEKNISAEYTTQKHAMLRQKETLEKALELVKKHAHSEFADSYKKFNELVSGDAPADTTLFAKSREAGEAVNKVYALSKTPIDKNSPAAQMLAHATAYLAELNTVEKEFHGVEASFVEVERYEKKVGKLNLKSSGDTKGSGSDKVADKTRRNVNKLETERAAFATKLDATIEMMKKSNAKYEKVLDCVFTAFWVTEDEFITSTDFRTKEVREKAKQAQAELVDLDVSKM